MERAVLEYYHSVHNHSKLFERFETNVIVTINITSMFIFSEHFTKNDLIYSTKVSKLFLN